MERELRGKEGERWTTNWKLEVSAKDQQLDQKHGKHGWDGNGWWITRGKGVNARDVRTAQPRFISFNDDFMYRGEEKRRKLEVRHTHQN